MNDLKFAFRQLLKKPGFTAVAVLSLSLGIAANTTIFSFVNALLIRPAPVEAPTELWQVWRVSLKSRSALERYHAMSYPGYTYFRDHNKSFASLAAFDPETPFVSWNRNGMGQSIQCQFVSGDFFSVCRIKMPLGRAFNSEEDRQPGAVPVAVVSERFWRTSLGSEPGIIGQSINLNGTSLTVIGVAPAGFTGLLAGLSPDIWAPFMMASSVLHDPEWHTRTGSYSLFGIGRLRSGIKPAQAEAELTGLTRQLEQIDPQHHKNSAAAVFPNTMVPAPFRGFVGSFTAILMGAVFMVLLIACANAANLMLARAVARRREMAVKASLGASRPRLIRQFLTESVIIGLLGGGLGLLMTVWFVPVLMRLTPPTLPIRPEIGLDARVFFFTAVISVLTGIIFGLAPAWQGTRVNLASALKEESLTIGAKRSRFASALIVAQLSVCLVLLISGALCVRSLLNAQNVNLGFKLKDRVTAEVNLKDYNYSEQQVQHFNEAFLERFSALPGVESAALADYLPLDTRYLGITYQIEGHEPLAGENGFTLETFNVGPRFFATMGTTLLRGREFLDGDRADSPAVIIINQAMAEKFWPGQNPIGRRLTNGKPGEGTAYEIVGVVETGKYRTLGEEPHPAVFRCRLQEGGKRSTFVAHVRGDPKKVMTGMQKVVQELDARLALSRLGTMEQHLALALFPARTTGLLFAVLGAVAMLLAVSGLFGVITYSVSQRTREIGVRMALGAKQADVLKMVLQQGVKLAGAGILIGLAGAFAATRLMRNLLYGIGATDPATFCLISLLLATVALIACWLPARRAAKVAPMEALRYE
jgi:predicted permease